MWSYHSSPSWEAGETLFEFQILLQSSGISTSAEQVSTSQVYGGPQIYRRHHDASGEEVRWGKEFASSAPMPANSAHFNHFAEQSYQQAHLIFQCKN
jgi:hypothetical protein